jgi:hypothetical protein
MNTLPNSISAVARVVRCSVVALRSFSTFQHTLKENTQ